MVHERNGFAAVRKEMGNGIAGDDREQEIDKRERIRHFLTVINIELLSSSAGVLPRKIAPKSALPLRFGEEPGRVCSRSDKRDRYLLESIVEGISDLGRM